MPWRWWGDGGKISLTRKVTACEVCPSPSQNSSVEKEARDLSLRDGQLRHNSFIGREFAERCYDRPWASKQDSPSSIW